MTLPPHSWAASLLRKYPDGWSAAAPMTISGSAEDTEQLSVVKPLQLRDDLVFGRAGEACQISLFEFRDPPKAFVNARSYGRIPVGFSAEKLKGDDGLVDLMAEQQDIDAGADGQSAGLLDAVMVADRPHG
jgi:hypothetical protein